MDTPRTRMLPLPLAVGNSHNAVIYVFITTKTSIAVLALCASLKVHHGIRRNFRNFTIEEAELVKLMVLQLHTGSIPVSRTIGPGEGDGRDTRPVGVTEFQCQSHLDGIPERNLCRILWQLYSGKK